MVLKEVNQYILVIMTGTAIFAHVAVGDLTLPMSPEEKAELREEAKDMFYHAYRAYMENAYPADELMPLSCKGRWKDPLNSRGDLDDVLGNFSLTLVDSLDTLVILGDLEEFESAVKLVIKDVSFDQDLIVSVFETNIRVLGGLLSAHIFAEYFQHRDGLMPWYRGELLSMAKDLGYRLLPAFNTTTGIPHSKVNLRHGLKNMRLSAHQETCTACAGSMILELATLSRLTGEPVFEQKAHKAMDGLWKMRHRSSDLMGTVLNVQSGDWVRRDSGVGAGIDSYYEYCLKAYILLGDEKYLGRFNKHYNAVMKYVSQGPMLVDVHMHRPHTNSKNFMDALLAFWPGLQVLKGDIKPAVETHEVLYQIMQRHNLIPDAFTVDFHVHWGQHPLRPEFLESTYFLYKATNDPYYLEVGKSALKGLQKFARVPCGYATIKDVRTGGHDDRMDSFVLAETFKYLYLLFAEPSDLLIDLDEFLFTTEAHLLPLSLSRKHNLSSFDVNKHSEDLEGLNSEFARCCPNTLDLFPESVRKSLKNFVIGVCPRTVKRNLLASEFTAGNQEHLKLLKNMGIAVLSMADGRIQLVHTITSARSQADAKEGVLFMQEMLELSQSYKQVPEKSPLSVIFRKNGKIITVAAGPANFGRELVGGTKVTAKAAVAEPIRACGTLANADDLKGRVVIVERGDCMFVNKVRKVEEAGAIAAIVIDNTPGTSSTTSSMFAMSGDGMNDVGIPAVFLFHEDAVELMKVIEDNLETEVTVTDANTTGFAKFGGGTSIFEEVKKEKTSDIRVRKEKTSDSPRAKTDFHGTSAKIPAGKETVSGSGQRTHSSADSESRTKSQLDPNQEWVKKTAQLLKNYANLEQDSQPFKIDFSGILNDLTGDQKDKQSSRNIDEKLRKDFGYVLRFKMHIQLLINKLDETANILKSLMAVKPVDWNENYGNHLSNVKETIKKLEESLKTIDVEAKYFEDPNCDIKLTSIDTVILHAKSKLDDIKKSLRRWDDSKTVVLDRNKAHTRNDDIIVVEQVKGKSGSRAKSKRKDEL